MLRFTTNFDYPHSPKMFVVTSFSGFLVNVCVHLRKKKIFWGGRHLAQLVE